MSKRNKVRYKSQPINAKELVTNGRVLLLYHDDEELELPQKGDLKLFPSTEALHVQKQGDYWSTGHAGYFRVDIYDGKEWQPVKLVDLFSDREHHYSKRECPIDTFELCMNLLQEKHPMTLKRTYREHYALNEEEE